MKNTGRLNLYSGKNTISAWLAWNAQLSYLHHNKTELGVQHGFAIVTFKSSDTSTFLQPNNPKPFSMIHFLKNKHLSQYLKNISKLTDNQSTSQPQPCQKIFVILSHACLLSTQRVPYGLQCADATHRSWYTMHTPNLRGIQLTLSPTFSSSMRVTLRIIDLLKLFHGTITIGGLRIQLC